MQTNKQPERKSAVSSIQAFFYPATPAPLPPSWATWSLEHSVEEVNSACHAGNQRDATDVSISESNEWETRLADEIRRNFEAGREQGIQEGREAERAERSAAANICGRSRLEEAARFLQSFEVERRRYFEAVEPEVVNLALAVAAKILRREAQMDPLLLTGAVRAALGQLPTSTQVRLRVPLAELELWIETMAHLPNLQQQPQVVAGEQMRLGDCTLETELGSVDLGVGSQLSEIERHLLASQRANPELRTGLAGVRKETRGKE